MDSDSVEAARSSFERLREEAMEVLQIWKFPVRALFGETDIPMPEGAKPLCIATQYNSAGERVIVLYALVDPTSPLFLRRVWCIGTGEPLLPAVSQTAQYVGTVQMGFLVYHVFVGREPEPEESQQCLEEKRS